ncbi:calcium-binding protein [Shimia ponticola]|uniref:calcium-binding protein n=1 Tax=Shimia ponticola TaxID=2582893 RepID=UPI0011BF5DAD|nr:calcium-binding protein [Shimia ponticola]
MAILSPVAEAASYELYDADTLLWLDENLLGQQFSNGDSFFLSAPTNIQFVFNFSPIVFLPNVNDFIVGPSVSRVDFSGTLFYMDGAFTGLSGSGTTFEVAQDIGFGVTGSFTVSALSTLEVLGNFQNSGRVDLFGAMIIGQSADIDVALKGNNAAVRIEGDMTGLVTTDAGSGTTRIIVDSGGELTADPVDNISFFVIDANSIGTDSVVVNNSGTITGLVFLSAGNDTVTNESGAVVNGSVALGGGGNALTNRGQITGDVTGGDDVDILVLTHGSNIGGGINLNDGNDSVGTTGFGAGSIIVDGPIFLGDGDDSFAGSFSNVGFDVDGNAGDDTITGSQSADRLSGGTGTNTLSGLGGGDTFVFNVESGSTKITDFSTLETIEIRGLVTEDFVGRMTVDTGKADTLFFGFEGRMTAARQLVEVAVSEMGDDTILHITSGLNGYSQTHRADFDLTITLEDFDIGDFELGMLDFVTSEFPMPFV